MSQFATNPWCDVSHAQLIAVVFWLKDSDEMETVSKLMFGYCYKFDNYH